MKVVCVLSHNNITLTSLTTVSFESSRAVAREAIHSVNASGTVLARITTAFVNICYKKHHIYINPLADYQQIAYQLQTFRDTFTIIIKKQDVFRKSNCLGFKKSLFVYKSLHLIKLCYMFILHKLSNSIYQVSWKLPRSNDSSLLH